MGDSSLLTGDQLIPLFKIYSDEADATAILSVLSRGSHWAEGPEIDQFEKDLINYLGIPGVLAVSSGTSALHLAMIACGIKPFHEVIVPSFTFIATANAARFVGARVVFADIEEQTYGLDPLDVEKRITGNTRAIIAVHYGGCLCQIAELKRIARKHKVLLIEDSAESLGATLNGVPTGSFSDCAILSFCQNKIIATGEGGAFITNNKYFYDRAVLFRSHGRQGGYFANPDYVCLGYNFRMPSMVAALGSSQLAKINKLIALRQRVAQWYDERLALTGITTPTIPIGRNHVYQLYTIRIPKKRDAVQRQLLNKDIASKIYFNPVHLTSFYRKGSWKIERLPVTERVASEVLSLPIYPSITESEVDQVCQAIKEVL